MSSIKLDNKWQLAIGIDSRRAERERERGERKGEKLEMDKRNLAVTIAEISAHVKLKVARPSVHM